MSKKSPTLQNRHNRLCVEGMSDLFVIAQLAEDNGIIWDNNNPPIYIESLNSKSSLVNSDTISTKLKDRYIRSLGIVIDADEDPNATWMSIRNACLKSIPDFPQDLPPTGLIHRTSDDINVGIWMMPDNQLRGMLETFLAYLVTENDGLWAYAQSTVDQAKSQGARFKPTHHDKANIHTWLAWQDEPGQQLHTALQKKILQPQHPKAQDFAHWLKRLYNLEGSNSG
jgi:hypothetical protein